MVTGLNIFGDYFADDADKYVLIGGAACDAILVLDEKSRKLGYIPEKDNLVFARLMDAGKDLTAKMTAIDKDTPFVRINIDIYLVDF